MKLISYLTTALLAAILMVSCATGNNSQNLSGIYTEQWFDSDIDYLDTLRITQSENLIKIDCINRADYIYKDIVSTGDNLSFTLLNDSDKRAPFFVYYKLKTQNQNNIMEGVANSNHNKDYKVKFTKIKSEK